jgi:hypothetical protein
VLRQDDYWHGERRIGPAFRPGELAGYPVDLRAKACDPSGPTNEVGVPLCDYGGDVGFRLHPVTVCQVALGWHDRWLMERQERHLERFFALADWLMIHQSERGAWPVVVTYRCYGRLEAPWVSALIQGQALSVLARAAVLRPAWARRARRAMEASFALFELDVARGGVRGEDDCGPAYEEYPSRWPSLVLNGNISALWGLYDLALVEGDGPARRAFDTAVQALWRRLPRYDLGFWSRYCLYPYPIPNVASPYYHRAHLVQLEAMERIAPHPLWAVTRARWAGYQERAACRTAALGAKGLFRLVHNYEMTGRPFSFSRAHEFEAPRVPA